MQKQVSYLECKTAPRTAKEERQKWKAIEKSVKSHPKRGGK
jgi:hypothetical protein